MGVCGSTQNKNKGNDIQRGSFTKSKSVKSIEDEKLQKSTNEKRDLKFEEGKRIRSSDDPPELKSTSNITKSNKQKINNQMEKTISNNEIKIEEILLNEENKKLSGIF